MQTLTDYKTEMGISKISFQHNPKKAGCAVAEPIKGVQIFMGKATTALVRNGATPQLFIIVNDGKVNAALKGSLWAVTSSLELLADF